jgi:rubredoxin
VERNPIFNPKTSTSQGRTCPKCQSKDFDGRNLGGVVTFQCSTCGNTWQGGLPSPRDPRTPITPTNPLESPTIQFDRNSKGQMVERFRRPSTTPNFRLGLPLPPSDGENDV